MLLKSLLKVANCPKLKESGEISFSKTKLKFPRLSSEKCIFLKKSDFKKALEISPENFKIQKLGENFKIQKSSGDFS